MNDASVSIAKALGIILMVLAHSGFSYIGDVAINMFHMPLFFFMSGYCFKDRYLANPKAFIKGKVKKVYIPYVEYSILFLLLHNVFVLCKLYNESGLYSLHDIINRAIHIFLSMGLHDQLLGGYWFMGNLFWGVLIAYFFLLICRNNTVIGIIFSLVISMIMNGLEIHIPVISVYYSDFFSSAFILAGIYYKRKGFIFEMKSYFILPISIILLALGTIYWRGCVPNIDMWKILPYYFTAIIGTLGVFSISKLIKGTIADILNYLGGKTLAVLTWHFLSFKLISLILIMKYNLSIESLGEFPIIHEYASKGWWVAYFLIGLLLPLGIDYIISHIKDMYRKCL